MPGWLKTLALANPLTYLVDALRSLMVPGVPAVAGLPMDFLVMGLVFILMVAVATRLYPNLVR